MTPYLLSILCDPEDHSSLKVKHPRYDDKGNIVSGILVSENGNTYPVRLGIPRFTGERERVRSAVSFREQHSQSHKDLYKNAWKNEFVRHTFGSTDVFLNKKVIDCGGGTGYQAKWMVENGAKHVIYLENSKHIDGIARECRDEHDNIDIVQCSLSSLPFKKKSFSGLITCNDVLQHAKSFDSSLKMLWYVLKENGEIAFSCPVRQTQRWYHRARYKFIDIGLRKLLSKKSPGFVEAYSRLVSLLHLIPFVGYSFVRNHLVYRTTKPIGKFCVVKRYKDAFHHTFEYFTGHEYEHLKTREEIKSLIHFLQKDPMSVSNIEMFFQADRPNGLAIRLRRNP